MRALVAGTTALAMPLVPTDAPAATILAFGSASVPFAGTVVAAGSGSIAVAVRTGAPRHRPPDGDGHGRARDGVTAGAPDRAVG